jgi:hypothetical protein
MNNPYSPETVIQLAYEVATDPTVAAYRGGASAKLVTRRKLGRLLDALAELNLTAKARAEVEERRLAIARADADSAEYWVEKLI